MASFGRKLKSITAVLTYARRALFGLVVVATSPSVVAAQEQLPSIQGTAVLPRDLSPWGMFMNADVVVKVVMVGLVVASFVTWTVWLAKTVELLKARWQVRSALNALSSIQTLANIKQSDLKEPAASFCAAALAEVHLSDAAADKEGLKERIASLARTDRSRIQSPN